MTPRPFVLRRALALMALVALAFMSIPTVAAQTDPAVEPPLDDGELSTLVVDLLIELDVDPEIARVIVDSRLDGIAARLDALVEAGALTNAQLRSLAEMLAIGAYDLVAPPRIADARERRDAVRTAAEALLADLGIVTDASTSIRDTLDDNGLSEDDFADLLDEIEFGLPDGTPPPGPTPVDGVDPVEGSTPPPPPPSGGGGEPADTEPTPTAPSGDYPTTAPTTTVPPYPSGDYPTTEPPPPTTTVPDGDYPTTRPRPPGGGGGGDYPTTRPGDGPPPPAGDETGGEY
ncbi:MAG: hypothetical protein AAF081_04745 [Actinomycetota bacterium]